MTSRFAHVVFASKKALQAALTARDEGSDIPLLSYYRTATFIFRIKSITIEDI